MIAGQEGQGKSVLTQAIAVGVARGRDVAGMVCHPGLVAVVDAENGRNLIQERLGALGLDRPHADRIAVFEARGFDVEADREQLAAVLRREPKRDLLILDSWVSLWHGSENAGPAVKRCLNGLRGLAQEFNVGILLIHHTEKEGKKYRGSSVIGGTIEAVFTFGREGVNDNSGHRVLACAKMRMAPEPKPRKLTIGAGGKLSVREGWVDEDDLRLDA